MRDCEPKATAIENKTISWISVAAILKVAQPGPVQMLPDQSLNGYRDPGVGVEVCALSLRRGLQPRRCHAGTESSDFVVNFKVEPGIGTGIERTRGEESSSIPAARASRNQLRNGR